MQMVGTGWFCGAGGCLAVKSVTVSVQAQELLLLWARLALQWASDQLVTGPWAVRGTVLLVCLGRSTCVSRAASSQPQGHLGAVSIQQRSCLRHSMYMCGLLCQPGTCTRVDETVPGLSSSLFTSLVGKVSAGRAAQAFSGVYTLHTSPTCQVVWFNSSGVTRLCLQKSTL